MDKAIFSVDGCYRYVLTRTDQGGVGVCMFIMLNPSTADATTNDPTIRRCIGFAKAWGFNMLVIGNLFAYRTKDPNELLMVDDPVGPDGNNDFLKGMALCADLVICAWGNGQIPVKGGHRALDVKLMLEDMGANLHTLGMTKVWQPKHPLYLKADTQPQEWT